MRVTEGLAGLRSVPAGAVLSVGNFDGVHRGHRKIVEAMKGLCAATRGGGGGRVVLVTFEPHPLTVLRPELAPPRLTPPDVKRAMLEAAGVHELVELRPTPDVLNVSAEAFWQILRDEVRPTHLVEGETFTFGKCRGGTIDRLREWSAGTGVQLHVIDPVSVPLLDMQVAPVSSSLIRWLLSYGRVRDAAICLGRPYAVRGEVVKGYQRGRTIGIPTANLRVDEQLVPADGVYAGRMAVAGRTYAAAVSIGTMPTFGADLKRQVEAYLIDFTGDLYGQTLELEIVEWLREQRKFNGVEALKQQMARDIDRAQDPATSADAEPIASLAG